MKLGNINEIGRELAKRYGDIYLDDNEVVSLSNSNPSTVAVLHCGRRGYLWVIPRDGSQPFEIEVAGAAREEFDTPFGWTHAG